MCPRRQATVCRCTARAAVPGRRGDKSRRVGPGAGGRGRSVQGGRRSVGFLDRRGRHAVHKPYVQRRRHRQAVEQVELDGAVGFRHVRNGGR